MLTQPGTRTLLRSFWQPQNVEAGLQLSSVARLGAALLATPLIGTWRSASCHLLPCPRPTAQGCQDARASWMTHGAPCKPALAPFSMDSSLKHFAVRLSTGLAA